jgi:hypothetical protein
MKTSLLFACAAVLGLASCASPIERRVTHNPLLFNKLSTADQLSVRLGQVKEGMTKEAVFLAWGRPSRIATGKKDGREFERWTYTEYEPVYSHTVGFGIGIGGGGWRHRGYYYDPFFYGGPTVDYLPTSGRSVEFVNGKVSGFLMPRSY